MMRFVYTFLIVVSSLSAGNYSEFMKYYKTQEYENACRVGKSFIYDIKQKDEKLLSLVANSCLECDYIYALSIVQHKLRATKSGRANGVVFSSIILQKKLIYQFMYDDADISTLALPVVEHPLSHTFVAIRDGNYKVISKNPKTIVFNKGDEEYKVYIDKEDVGRVIIEIKDKNNNTQKRRYF